ncbi:hypothetical protein AVEN_219735-1 [Araneus ventricosus]|uniref:Uncharacterized protein n=1 Tax=Araneus ventricosus TaxID=182803 RepID=A0A4Y2UI14_ARAVE|nr:hypothetical protein AVEN_219735-1 [Araneus ventricosus]
MSGELNTSCLIQERKSDEPKLFAIDRFGLKDFLIKAGYFEARRRLWNLDAPRQGGYKLLDTFQKLISVTSRYGSINMLEREISKGNVKMVALQQTARLWFHESKSIVTVQSRFRLEYQNFK